MAEAIVMPKLGNTTEECILIGWQIAVGDTVETGQIIGDIETDKATFELESTESGTVLALLCEEGDAVPVMQNIAIVGEAGEDISAFTAGETAEAEETAVAEEIVKTSAAETVAAPRTAAAGAAVGVSPRARNTAVKVGIDPASIAGSGPEGRIIERDILKAAEARGPMTSLAKAIAADTDKTAAGSGTGIAGRITAADLSAASAASAGGDQYEEIKLSGIRKLIAGRMHESLQKTAQLTLHMTASAASMLALRKRIKADGETMGMGNVTLNDMIMFAVSRILPQHPGLNATFDGSAIRQYNDVNLAFACNTDRGLMVPVINGSQKLTLDQISSSIRELAGQAREGKINPDLLQGGTFTISNLGMLGITGFTPILNYPQVALLGVNTLELKPIRTESGEVVYEDHISFSLTINHEVIDGWDGGRFLQDLCRAIANFDLLLTQG